MATFRARKNAAGKITGYQAQIIRRGWPRQYATFDSMAAARAWARRTEADMDVGVQRDIRRAKTLVSEILAAYIDHRLKDHPREGRIRSTAKPLIATLGRYTATTLTSDVVADYRDQRLKHVGPQTIIHELGLLQRACIWAASEQRIPFPSGIPTRDVARPQKPRGRTRRVGNDELAAVAAASDSEHLATWITLAVETAMRREEISAMTWQHVHLDAHYIHLPKTKNGSSREVPLSPRAVEVLHALGPKRTGALFGVAPDSITRAFIRARDRARTEYEKECKEKDVTPDKRWLVDLRYHDLRHEATSRLADKLTVLDLARVTGHSDTKMLLRYYHPTGSELARKLRS